MKVESRLGKGLGAFFENSKRGIPVFNPADNKTQGAAAKGNPGDALYIPIGSIRPNPNQPRKRFDEESLKDLAESIKKDGLLQPILVREAGPDSFEIIAGERRFRAAEMAGIEKIPSIIKNLDEKQAFEIALIENIQRENLNPVEEAEGYQKLMSEYGYTQQEVSALVHKSRPYIANIVRILSLPKDVQGMVSDGRLPYTVARTLIGSEDPAGMARSFLEENVNAREAEKKAKARTGAPPADPRIIEMQEDLTLKLGMPVEIKKDKSGNGHVLIRYMGREQFKEIIKLLNN
jgi:ParB family chromosome partitioning protein